MAKQKICGVYKITNRVNGKIYVGSSKNIYERWNQHKDKLRNNCHDNAHLQNAWIKYGENNFKFEIIEECDPNVQFEREQYYLNTLNPFDRVLARNDREAWSCVFFSHIVKDEETYPYACGYDWFTQCIPYNDDTKHLVGTTKEAPDFYRCWED